MYVSQLHDSASSGINGLSFKGKTPKFDPLANKNYRTDQNLNWQH